MANNSEQDRSAHEHSDDSPESRTTDAASETPREPRRGSDAERFDAQDTQPTTQLPSALNDGYVQNAAYERPQTYQPASTAAHANDTAAHANDTAAHANDAAAPPNDTAARAYGTEQAVNYDRPPAYAQGDSYAQHGASQPEPWQGQPQQGQQQQGTQGAYAAYQPEGVYAAPQSVAPAPQPAPPAPAPPAQKGRTGVLLAGLAIGALLGGIVGGGVAAVVASNGSSPSVAQGGGAITLNNAENATAISGVAAAATPSVVTLEVANGSSGGSGSGVIYSEDGYILTNAHVVTLDGAALDGADIRVKLSDGRILDAELVGTDPYADLAVVKVNAENLPAVKVADSDKLNVGDLTVAIGAPLNLANTVTSGVVSALNRGISVGSPLVPEDQTQPDDDVPENGEGDDGFPWDFRFENPEDEESGQASGGTVTLPVVQTDASINPGNSGGALLNGKGELIGVNVAIASAATESGAAGSDGLGFAIPSNLATRVADEIIAGEQPSHGLLGAAVADSNQDTDEDANHAGGLLVDVVSGGAADKGGLEAGDVITAIDGVPAVDGTSVSALIRVHEGGSTVTIDYTRNGEAAQTEVELGTLEW